MRLKLSMAGALNELLDLLRAGDSLIATLAVLASVRAYCALDLLRYADAQRVVMLVLEAGGLNPCLSTVFGNTSQVAAGG